MGKDSAATSSDESEGDPRTPPPGSSSGRKPSENGQRRPSAFSPAFGGRPLQHPMMTQHLPVDPHTAAAMLYGLDSASATRYAAAAAAAAAAASSPAVPQTDHVLNCAALHQHVIGTQAAAAAAARMHPMLLTNLGMNSIPRDVPYPIHPWFLSRHGKTLLIHYLCLKI